MIFVKAIEWLGGLVLLFVLFAPAIYLIGGLGSLGKDAVTERRIRNLFRYNKPGEAFDKFEALVGTADPEMLHEMMLMTLRSETTGTELGEYAVAYWKGRLGPRLYDFD